MSTIEQTQNTNGQGSLAKTMIIPTIAEEPTLNRPSPNLNNRTAINQDSFSFKNIHSLRFVFQGAFSTLILIFCLFQLSISNGNGKNDAVYWSSVTGILALWMPSPCSSETPPANQPNLETAESTGKRN